MQQYNRLTSKKLDTKFDLVKLYLSLFVSASELECGGYLVGLIYGAILLVGTGPGRNLLGFLAWELQFSKDYDLYLP